MRLSYGFNIDRIPMEHKKNLPKARPEPAGAPGLPLLFSVTKAPARAGRGAPDPFLLYIIVTPFPAEKSGKTCRIHKFPHAGT